MKKIILIMIIFLVALSCNKEKEDENCLEYKTAHITNVIAPSSGIVGEDVSIEVFFSITNGCQNFSKFVENVENNISTIELIRKEEGCICTNEAVTLSVNYIFNTQTAGDYVFKFKSGENEFITVNITIE